MTQPNLEKLSPCTLALIYSGSRSIRTNWSTRKPPPPRTEKATSRSKQPTFEEVYNQSSPTNSTVYCGGFTNGVTDELMHKTFAPFGVIQDIRVFKDKGYAFIRFSSKDEATHAIEAMHNSEVNGQMVKCFWGKENGGLGPEVPPLGQRKCILFRLLVVVVFLAFVNY